jgi:hypothetical protein
VLRKHHRATPDDAVGSRATLKKRVWVGLLGVLVPVSSSGCGSDEALTGDQYVAKLNAMCEDFSAREEQIGEPRSLAGLVENGPRILEAFDEAILEKVDDLDAPAAIADPADRLVDIAHQQHDVLRELIRAAEDGDLSSVRTLVSKNDALNTEASSIARRLGAEACAEG